MGKAIQILPWPEACRFIEASGYFLPYRAKDEISKDFILDAFDEKNRTKIIFRNADIKRITIVPCLKSLFVREKWWNEAKASKLACFFSDKGPISNFYLFTVYNTVLPGGLYPLAKKVLKLIKNKEEQLDISNEFRSSLDMTILGKRNKSSGTVAASKAKYDKKCKEKERFKAKVADIVAKASTGQPVDYNLEDTDTVITAWKTYDTIFDWTNTGLTISVIVTERIKTGKLNQDIVATPIGTVVHEWLVNWDNQIAQFM